MAKAHSRRGWLGRNSVPSYHSLRDGLITGWVGRRGSQPASLSQDSGSCRIKRQKMSKETYFPSSSLPLLLPTAIPSRACPSQSSESLPKFFRGHWLCLPPEEISHQLIFPRRLGRGGLERGGLEGQGKDVDSAVWFDQIRF